MVTDTPIVCGGFSSSRTHDQCYMMDLEKRSWKFLTNMTTARYGSASVAIDRSLFIVGGFDGNGYYANSTEYVRNDGFVFNGPDFDRVGHCMVTLPSGKVMIIGGTSRKGLSCTISLDQKIVQRYIDFDQSRKHPNTF